MGWQLVDIANGPFVLLDGVNGQAPVIWSAGGASAVTLIGADLVVVSLDGVAVVDGLGSMRALAGSPVASAE